MKPVRTFETSSTLVNLQLYSGIAVALIGGFLLMQGGPASPFGAGVLLLVIGAWNMRHEPVRLYREHMELKFAPAASLRLIRYRDLVRVEGDSEKVRSLFYRDAGKEKKLKLRLDMLNADDRPRLLGILEEKIRENATGSAA